MVFAAPENMDVWESQNPSARDTTQVNEEVILSSCRPQCVHSSTSRALIAWFGVTERREQLQAVAWGSRAARTMRHIQGRL